MKKLKLWFVYLLVVLALAIACGPVPDSGTTTPAAEDIFPRPTITPIPQGSESDALPVPAATADPSGYPPSANQPESAYPGGGEQLTQPSSPYPAAGSLISIVFPVGVQCEEGSQYANIDEAVEALAKANVVATEQGTVSLMVAAACGQPTSEHYHVQILAEGLSAAQALGWQQYEE